MKCQECQQRPATVRLVRIVNGQKVERYLCEECAREKGDPSLHLQSGFPLGNLLAGMLGDDWWSGTRKPAVTSAPCPSCGMTHEEFARTGLLGCGDCYRAFEAVVDPVLQRVHGHRRHSGRAPRSQGVRMATGQRLKELREQLQDLVGREEFEQAAILRDRIRGLETSSHQEEE